MTLANHPTVKQVLARQSRTVGPPPSPLEAAWLKQLALDAGADDVGLVEIDRKELDDQRDEILRLFPKTKTLLSFVVRLNREPIRSTARSVANLEFHHAGNRVDDISRALVGALEERGVGAVNPAMGFPMEMQRFPGKIWVVAHKPVAAAAGLGVMGIHRNVIHQKFGNFILLGTVLIAAEATRYDRPIDFNPCLECKLCVAVCPVGAISPLGDFNFSACYSHNYREFMGGFTDWAEELADSRNRLDYRRKVPDSESVSMWQSLSFGANYKAAYCLAVCPAGEDVIGSFLAEQESHLREIVRPLQEKRETVFVLKNSDAEAYAARRFPNKTITRVGNSLRPTTIEGFLRGAPLVFQPGKSSGLNATYHFTFVGDTDCQATIVIADEKIAVHRGHVGEADLRITADAKTWIGFLRNEKNIVWAILRRKVRLKGSLSLLLAFGKCFPR